MLTTFRLRSRQGQGPAAVPLARTIGAYVTAIVAMCSLAVAHGAASGSRLIGVGAPVFAAADNSFARGRFVAPGFSHKTWGLPLYYSAQLLLA